LRLKRNIRLQPGSFDGDLDGIQQQSVPKTLDFGFGHEGRIIKRNEFYGFSMQWAECENGRYSKKESDNPSDFSADFLVFHGFFPNQEVAENIRKRMINALLIRRFYAGPKVLTEQRTGNTHYNRNLPTVVKIKLIAL
jgi:ribonuclease I